MKPKIAIFQKNLLIGGIQRSLINLLNTIDLAKFDIDLYLFSNFKFYSDKLPKEVNVIYLKGLNKFVSLMPFKLLNKFYKNSIKEKYDIAIDFDGYSNDTALAMLNCNSNKKVIWVHQDLYERKKRDIKYRYIYYTTKSKYKYVDEIIGVSRGVIDSLKKLLKFNFKYTIIPNLIPAEQLINKSKELTNFKIDNNKINIISVGRLCYQKGFDILINYMKEIVINNKNIILYIIGDGPDYKKLKKLIKKYNLNDNIFLLGSKTNPFNIMAKMDAFVLTSRFEGQGMVILEAKALGLPIIITKNLEKYNENVVGTENFVQEILNLKKNRSRNKNYLEDYNQNIINSLNLLFNLEQKDSDKI